MPEDPQRPRHHDVDWLRVLAIGLLLLFHAALAFEPWGTFIQNDEPIGALVPLVALLAAWRIPLLFFVSGMGLCWASRRRTFVQLLVERTRRILVPTLFGVFAVVPLHALVCQRYDGRPLAYAPDLWHLWFLAYIYAYVLCWGYGLHWLCRHDNAMVRGLRRLVASRFGIWVFAPPFALEAAFLAPAHYGAYVDNQHGIWLGALAFATGVLFAAIGEPFWHAVVRLRWPNAGLAVLLFAARACWCDHASPPSLGGIEMLGWVLALFGFARRHLDRDGPALGYLRRAAYPVYIVHMLFQYVTSAMVMQTALPALAKFAIVVAGSLGGSLLAHELLIRRLPILRPLFGLPQRSA